MHAYNHSRLVGTVGRSLLHNVDMWQYSCNIGRTRDRLGQMQGKCNQLCPLAGSVGIYHSSRSAEGARLVVCSAGRLSCVVDLVECVVGWACSRCYQLVHPGCHAARAKTKKQVSDVSLLKNRCRKKCPRSPGPPASTALKLIQGNAANCAVAFPSEKKITDFGGFYKKYCRRSTTRILTGQRVIESTFYFLFRDTDRKKGDKISTLRN